MMTWILLAAWGAFAGGLLFGLKETLVYLGAKRRGVIVRRGAKALQIRRDEEPERFAGLLARRGKSAGLYFGLAILGGIVLGLFGMAITGGPVGPFAAIMLAFAVAVPLFALFCLIRGFATGRMFAFWGLLLYGEATLKQNAIWFWVYAFMNAVTVAMAALTLLPALLARI